MDFRFQVFFLSFFAAIAFSRSQATYCRISKDDACKNNHVFAEVTGTDHLSLLTQNDVPINGKLFLACSNEDKIKQVTCNNGGAFSIDFRQMENCNKQLPIYVQDPLIQEPCGPNGAFLYVGYSAAFNSIHYQFLSLYRTCYNGRSVQSFFTEHVMWNYQTNICRGHFQFVGQNIISPGMAAGYTMKNVYETFVTLLGAVPTGWFPDDKTLVIARGHLAPSNDFPFRYLMKATFHLINVVPMFQSINTGNWLKIENWVRNTAEREGYVKVVSGAHDVLELPHAFNGQMVKMYLLQRALPIPKWIYKIVKTKTETYTFITYNNAFATTNPTPLLCPPIACPTGFVTPTTWNVLSKGYTYCCRIGDVKDIFKLSDFILK